MSEQRVTQLSLILERTEEGKKARMDPPSVSAFRCQNNFQQFVTEGIYIYLKVSQVLSRTASGWLILKQKVWRIFFFTTISQPKVAPETKGKLPNRFKQEFYMMHSFRFSTAL